MKKTKEEVQAEITKLEEIKPRVRHYSMFGDNNRQAIDVQIDVLKRNLSTDDIYAKYSDDLNLRSAADEAHAWLHGKSECESLVDEWQSLAE